MNDLYATDCGVHPAYSAEVNTQALAYAIDKAVAERRLLHLPHGTVQIDSAGSLWGGGALRIGGSLRMVGAGMELTTLKLVNWTKDVGGALIGVTGGQRVELENLTLEGPDDINHGDVDSEQYACFGILHFGGTSSGGRLVLRRVRTLWWNQAVKMSFGAAMAGALELHDCEIGARGVHILHTDGAVATPDESVLVARDTRFVHDSETMRNAIGDGTAHCLYVNKGVSIDMSGCDFVSAGSGPISYGLTHFGGNGLAVARRVSLSDCHFRSGVKNGIGTGPALTQLRGVALGCSDAALLPQGPVVCSGLLFYGRGRVSNSVGASADLRIEDSEFRTVASAVTDLMMAQPGAYRWHLRGVRFGTVPVGESNIWLRFFGGHELVAEDCRFDTASGYPITVHGGRARLIRCSAPGGRPVLLYPQDADASLHCGQFRHEGGQVQISPVNGHTVSTADDAASQWTVAA